MSCRALKIQHKSTSEGDFAESADYKNPAGERGNRGRIYLLNSAFASKQISSDVTSTLPPPKEAAISKIQLDCALICRSIQGLTNIAGSISTVSTLDNNAVQEHEIPSRSPYVPYDDRDRFLQIGHKLLSTSLHHPPPPCTLNFAVFKQQQTLSQDNTVPSHLETETSRWSIQMSPCVPGQRRSLLRRARLHLPTMAMTRRTPACPIPVKPVRAGKSNVTGPYRYARAVAKASSNASTRRRHRDGGSESSAMMCTSA